MKERKVKQINIKSVRLLGKSKNQIVVNKYYIFKLRLRKDKLHHYGAERICLSAKKIGYTTTKEVFKKRGENVIRCKI